MKVNKLVLNNFRNYNSGCWVFSAGLNIFYGNNGQGKTNLLEALYFSALGASHRTFQENDLIKQRADEMSVSVHFTGLYTEKNINIKKSADRSKKEIILDNNKIKPRELIGELKVTIFSPEDLQLVKNEPAQRRRFIDMEISQISSNYCFSLARYNKIVQQRNKLLNEIRENGLDRELLDIWDKQFAHEAAYIVYTRLKSLEKLGGLSNDIYQGIAGKQEKVESIYKRRENQGDCFIDCTGQTLAVLEAFYLHNIQERRAQDIGRGATGIGPHRDDILFSISGHPLKNYGSQGQQRSFVLALKLAELQYIKDETGEFPILLLDDVMSELDPARRQNLLDFLKGRVQTFITLTDRDLVDHFKDASYYHVQEGKIIEADPWME